MVFPSSLIATSDTSPESSLEKSLNSKMFQLAPGQARGERIVLVRPLSSPLGMILAAATEEDPHLYSALARDLAPGIPAFQMSHVLALWQSGDVGAATGVFGDYRWGAARKRAIVGRELAHHDRADAGLA